MRPIAFFDFDLVGSFWQGWLFGVADGLLMFRSSVGAFYPWLLCLFYSKTGSIRRDRFIMFCLLPRVGLEIEKIVHGMPEILFAAEIAFRSLYRCMPEQELNLLQFTTTVVAQLRTCPAQVVRGDSL